MSTQAKSMSESVVATPSHIELSMPDRILIVVGLAIGVALYAVALPLVSAPSAFPLWTRIIGTLAAIPFATYSLLWLLGRSTAPSGPIVSFGYILLTVAIVGWIITVLRATPSSQR